jgi:hypothetical protein
VGGAVGGERAKEEGPGWRKRSKNIVYAKYNNDIMKPPNTLKGGWCYNREYNKWDELAQSAHLWNYHNETPLYY